MKWRRGIILAGIHFVIAASLILWVLVPQFTSEKTHSLNPNSTLRPTAYQEEGQTVEFSPSNVAAHNMAGKSPSIVGTPRCDPLGLERGVPGGVVGSRVDWD
jgi:hypothetical protein